MRIDWEEFWDHPAVVFTIIVLVCCCVIPAAGALGWWVFITCATVLGLNP